MSEHDHARAHWEREGLLHAVLAALTAAGVDLDRVSVDDLALTDQFHNGGRAATMRLAELAGLEPARGDDVPLKVLDVGGGLGGPARTLATAFGCEVTAVDLTPSYVEVAVALTEMVGLADRVHHQVGDALDLPFERGAFDMVWTQNSGMNIADKEGLYREFRRVLRDGGTLAFQEPMAGDVEPLHYPLMWAEEPSLSFLVRPDELLALISGIGFETRAWERAMDVPAPPAVPAHSVQVLVMGEERLAKIVATGVRNSAEGRLLTMLGVFTKH